MLVPPKHPKMIIFSGIFPWLLGKPIHFRKSPYSFFPKNHGISKLVVWRSQNPAENRVKPLHRRVQWFLGFNIFFRCVLLQWFWLIFPRESAINHGAYLHVPFCIHKGLPENEASKISVMHKWYQYKVQEQNICKKHDMIMSTEYGWHIIQAWRASLIWNHWYFSPFI